MDKEMVLFPSESQFNEKTDELMVDECYWTIPTYPKNKENLIGSKIYFYDKALNRICLRSTVTKFEDVEGKKAVFFDMGEDDWEYGIDLEEKGIPRRTQSRGWAYRWW